MSTAATPQPAPQPGQRVVLDQVVADLRDRAEMGKRKYGSYLMTHNGRDALWDAYQEALDLVMYLRQAILEREETRTLDGESAPEYVTRPGYGPDAVKERTGE